MSRNTARASMMNRLRARRNAREFERALASASPAMRAELQAIAARQTMPLL